MNGRDIAVRKKAKMSMLFQFTGKNLSLNTKMLLSATLAKCFSNSLM